MSTLSLVRVVCYLCCARVLTVSFATVSFTTMSFPTVFFPTVSFPTVAEARRTLATLFLTCESFIMTILHYDRLDSRLFNNMSNNLSFKPLCDDSSPVGRPISPPARYVELGVRSDHVPDQGAQRGVVANAGE